MYVRLSDEVASLASRGEARVVFNHGVSGTYDFTDDLQYSYSVLASLPRYKPKVYDRTYEHA